MRRFLLALLLLPLLVGCASTAATGERDAAIATVEAFHAALASGNGERALAHLAPDVVIYEGGGVEASRDEYASHHLGADMAFSSAVERTIWNRRATVSGDVAWVLTESSSSGTFRERPIDVSGVETMILRRTADGWKISHIHWSSRSNAK